MNTYKVTATRQDGTQFHDNVTEATEGAARRDFKEIYRHGGPYTITNVELVADNALASKQQERDALEKIRKIVDSLGPDSYLATAFTGCFQDAEDNIENDFAMSMSGRWQYAEEQLEKKKAEVERLQAELSQQAKNHEDDARRFAAQKQTEIAGLEEALTAAKSQVETTAEFEISDELLADLATFTDTYVYEVRAAAVKNITTIAQDATLVKLLHEYATRKQAELDQYRSDLRSSVRLGMEFRHSNNCLTHSDSYSNVIYDLLRPYWEKEGDRK